MKSKIKLFINITFIISILLIIIYNDKISTYIINNYIYNKNKPIEITKNMYSLNRDFEYVQITDDFVAKDYQHLLNIIYTIIDSGNEEFSFFCDDKYERCISDIDALIPASEDTNSYDVLSDINNLVHPFNTYRKLTVVMNNYGKVIIKVTKQYDNEQVKYINDEVAKIEGMMKTDLTTKDKIKVFHDYIINTTKYDKERAGRLNAREFKNSESHTATGLLKNHLALCGGYSDIMSIYLSRLNIPNIRISAEKHVWNLVYIDNKWLHIDATWDDPVTNTGKQILIHDYYLIDTATLMKQDTVEHNYNKNFYKEAN